MSNSPTLKRTLTKVLPRLYQSHRTLNSTADHLVSLRAAPKTHICVLRAQRRSSSSETCVAERVSLPNRSSNSLSDTGGFNLQVAACCICELVEVMGELTPAVPGACRP